MGKEAAAEKVVQEIRRKTRRRFSAEEKVRIVLEGLRGEESIATLCRKEGLAPTVTAVEHLDSHLALLTGNPRCSSTCPTR